MKKEISNNDSLILVCDKNKSHFALPIIKGISNKTKVSKSESKYNFLHKLRCYNKNIIWVEWARKQAVYISNHLKPNQKLFIRLHRFEINDTKTLNQINWEKVYKVIFVNSAIEKQFKKIITSKVDTIVIPNAVEINNFDLTKRNSKNKLLTYAWQFDEVKGYINLIEIFKKIISCNQNFSLTIAAQKPALEQHISYFNRCQSLIDKYNLNKYIFLKILPANNNELKTHSNIKQLLADHNGIISYSRIESFHYAFAEGLLSGLQGFFKGWGDLCVKEFWDKWSYKNEEDFINGIINWGDSTVSNRNSIASINRNYIINNFSSDIIAKKYYNLFYN